jgi:hypothetical protein
MACASKVGFLHDVGGHDGRRFAIRDQGAVVQHDDAVGQRAHHIHLVFDQQHGLVALLLHLADQVQHHGHFVHAHAGRGFVEHHHIRLQCEHDRHFQLALVAMGQGGDGRVAPRSQVHALQVMVGALD